jgi:hypothetical protein
MCILSILINNIPKKISITKQPLDTSYDISDYNYLGNSDGLMDSSSSGSALYWSTSSEFV